MVEYIFFEKKDSDKHSDIWNQISKLRYAVYSLELEQYENNINESLEDPGKYFITCVDDSKLVGYVSLNDSQNIRMKKFTPEEIFESEILQNLSGEISSTFEVRALTVEKANRGKKISEGLMINALRRIHNMGGTDIIAMGHKNVLQLYEKI